MKLKLKWRSCLYCIDINTDQCIMWDQLASEYILYIWFTKRFTKLKFKKKAKRTKSKNKNKNIFSQIQTEYAWI